MTARLEVHGRDAAREAYRISTGGITALVPECLMQSLRPGTRPSHQDAYEWIAAHRARIHAAITDLAAGKTPPPPFDLIELSNPLHLAR